MPMAARIVPLAYLLAHASLWLALGRREGRAINPLLGMTAMLLLLYSLLFLVLPFPIH